MKFKSLGMVLTTTLLGCGSGGSSEPMAADAPSQSSRASAVSTGKKKIVNAPVAAQSACAALYWNPQAQAALTQAVVDPRLQADGAVRTLILSFNEDAAIPAALNTLTGALGLVVGQNLGTLQELPMVALSPRSPSPFPAPWRAPTASSSRASSMARRATRGSAQVDQLVPLP